MQEKGQVVCPKTMRCIPKNYVPCVFLGQQELVAGSKCPATGWESPALLEEQSSRSSIELNNNACLNKESLQWSEICTTKPSKEVQYSPTDLLNHRTAHQKDVLYTESIT